MTRTQPFTITSIVSLRRFLTHDPTGFTTGLNLYAYLKNNPLKYCDPTGEFFFLIPLLVFGSEGVAFLGMSTMTAALLDAACCAVISYSCLKLNDSIDRRSYSLPKYKAEESLHPDFNHPDHQPHWDYIDPSRKGYRLNTDGTWETK